MYDQFLNWLNQTAALLDSKSTNEEAELAAIATWMNWPMSQKLQLILIFLNLVSAAAMIAAGVLLFGMFGG